MIALWRPIAAACMIVTGALAFIGGPAVMRALFLVELLIVLSLACIDLSGGLRLNRLFELPVFFTVRMAFSFAIIPMQAILIPEKLHSRLQGDFDLILQALLLVIAGMAGFWVGCQAAHRRSTIKAKLVTGARSLRSTLAVTVAVYAIGFGCKVYLLQNELFEYTASLQLYRNNLAGAQWFMFGSTFATLALILICIERFSYPSNGMVRWLFWGIVLSESGWGLVSGMKSVLLIDFLIIGAVSTLCTKKLANKWVLCAVLGLVLVYPLFNSYRSVLRGAGSNQVSTFGGAFTALSQATGHMAEDVAYGDWIQNGADLTIARLDLLQSFGLILSFPNHAAELQGEERLWMIPFYAFIPRTIWPSKPVLDEGSRLNKALGGTGDSSEAVPYIADCYSFGGVLGVIVGMFALGLFAQLYANGVTGTFAKKHVFRCSVALLFCFKIEIGIVEWWVLVIKTMVVVSFVEWLAYEAGSKRTERMVLRTTPSELGRSTDRTLSGASI